MTYDETRDTEQLSYLDEGHRYKLRCAIDRPADGLAAQQA
jgi:hypothetical protein